MNRRLFLLAPLALAACQGATATQVATDVAAGVAAAQAIQAVAADLQAIGTAGLSAQGVADVSDAIKALQSVAVSLSAASTAPQVASAASTVSSVLTTIESYLPDVAALLPLLAMVHDQRRVSPWTAAYVSEAVVTYDDVMNPIMHLVADTPRKPLTDAQRKKITADLAALAAAVAKAKAAAVRP